MSWVRSLWSQVRWAVTASRSSRPTPSTCHSPERRSSAATTSSLRIGSPARAQVDEHGGRQVVAPAPGPNRQPAPARPRAGVRPIRRPSRHRSEVADRPARAGIWASTEGRAGTRKTPAGTGRGRRSGPGRWPQLEIGQAAVIRSMWAEALAAIGMTLHRPCSPARTGRPAREHSPHGPEIAYRRPIRLRRPSMSSARACLQGTSGGKGQRNAGTRVDGDMDGPSAAWHDPNNAAVGQSDTGGSPAGRWRALPSAPRSSTPRQATSSHDHARRLRPAGVRRSGGSPRRWPSVRPCRAAPPETACPRARPSCRRAPAGRTGVIAILKRGPRRLRGWTRARGEYIRARWPRSRPLRRVMQHQRNRVRRRDEKTPSEPERSNPRVRDGATDRREAVRQPSRVNATGLPSTRHGRRVNGRGHEPMVNAGTRHTARAGGTAEKWRGSGGLSVAGATSPSSRVNAPRRPPTSGTRASPPRKGTALRSTRGGQRIHTASAPAVHRPRPAVREHPADGGGQPVTLKGSSPPTPRGCWRWATPVSTAVGECSTRRLPAERVAAAWSPRAGQGRLGPSNAARLAGHRPRRHLTLPVARRFDSSPPARV